MFLMETTYTFHPMNLLEICAAIVFHSAKNVNPNVLVHRRVRKAHSSREGGEEKRGMSKGYGEEYGHASERGSRREDSRTGSRVPSREYNTPSVGHSSAPPWEVYHSRRSRSDGVITRHHTSGAPAAARASRERSYLNTPKRKENDFGCNNISVAHSSHRCRRGSGNRGRPGSAPPTSSSMLFSNSSTHMSGKPPLAEEPRRHHRDRIEGEKAKGSHRHQHSSSFTGSRDEKDRSPGVKKVRGPERALHPHKRGGSWLNFLFPSCLTRTWSSRRVATKLALWYTHLFHSLPVSLLHYLSELQRQQAVLPILRFSDISECRMQSLSSFISCGVVPPTSSVVLDSFSSLASRAESSSSPLSSASKLFSSDACKVLCYQRLFSSLPACGVATDSLNGSEGVGKAVDCPLFNPSFLVLREIGRLLFAYIKDVFFMDNTIVVRQLRSRHFGKRALGWCARVVSHSLLDAVFLSVLTPVVCMKVQDLSAPEPFCVSIPGSLKGLAWTTGIVLIQGFVLPTLSHLVNRSIITVFEGLEYFIQRRYSYMDPYVSLSSNSSSFSLSPSHRNEGDHLTPSLQAPSRSVSEIIPSLSHQSQNVFSKPAYGDKNQLALEGGTISIVSAPQPPKLHQSGKTGDTAEGDENIKNVANEDAGLAQRLSDQEKLYAELRRKKRQAREKHVQVMERRAQQVVVRAILYRMISLVVAQVVVEHPVMVLVEGLRGRAVMHFTGFLREYDISASSNDFCPYRWSGWCSYWRYITGSSPSYNGDEEEGIDPFPNQSGTPPVVSVLRAIWVAGGQEVEAMWNAVVRVSGESSAISELLQRVSQSGKLSSVGDSFQLAWHSCMGLRSLYSGVSFTVFDALVSFYMATWTRLQG